MANVLLLKQHCLSLPCLVVRGCSLSADACVLVSLFCSHENETHLALVVSNFFGQLNSSSTSNMGGNNNDNDLMSTRSMFRAAAYYIGQLLAIILANAVIVYIVGFFFFCFCHSLNNAQAITLAWATWATTFFFFHNSHVVRRRVQRWYPTR